MKSEVLWFRLGALSDWLYTTILCVCLYTVTGYVDGKCPLVIQFKVIQKVLTF